MTSIILDYIYIYCCLTLKEISTIFCFFSMKEEGYLTSPPLVWYFSLFFVLLLCISFLGLLLIKYHKTVCLKQQKFIALQFQRLEVQNQGVAMVASFWELWGRICSLPLSKLLVASGFPWLVDGILPVSSHSLPSMHVYLCVWICAFYNSPLG